MRSDRPEASSIPHASFLICLIVFLAVSSHPLAENIDPDRGDARYAWGENVGWFNAQPLGPGGPGLQIDDFEVTGWMYGENIGWVSASCKNTLSCDRVRYGVRHDGAGNLFGEAWAENLGWILFAPSIGGVPVAGVTIDPLSGDLGGTAWSENGGWVDFGLGDIGLSPIRTSWTCDPGAPPPIQTPLLQVERIGGETRLIVSGASDATGYDIVSGDLRLLRATGGDFRTATESCVADNSTFGAEPYSTEPGPGEGIWFVVRGVTCNETGSYDVPDEVGGPSSQVGSRDMEIDASTVACP